MFLNCSSFPSITFTYASNLCVASFIGEFEIYLYGVSKAELNEGHQLHSYYRWQQTVAKFMNMIEEVNIDELGRFMDLMDSSLNTIYFYFFKRRKRDSLTSPVWGFIIKTIW